MIRVAKRKKEIRVAKRMQETRIAELTKTNPSKFFSYVNDRKPI